MDNTELVGKLWSLCNVLRDDGITFHQYLSELSTLLFLKMAKETGTERPIPVGWRWSDLKALKGKALLDHYRHLFTHLASHGSACVRSLFANTRTDLSRANSLEKLVLNIDRLDWFSVRREALGNIYEGLLEKNATDKKSGAGQYFTPRELIDSIVSLIKPRFGECIQDPAAGTAGFLVAAHLWMGRTLRKTKSSKGSDHRLIGVELVPDVHRLGKMNLFLHGIEANFLLGDTLAEIGQTLPLADVVTTNPPFGSRKGGDLGRNDLPYPTSNKQFSFLQHVITTLKPGGRAAVIVPDNVLFEDGKGTDIRKHLLNSCNVHTILKLPTGLFYSQGVKTNVLFFTKQTDETRETSDVWVYDLRTGVRAFGRTRPFSREYLAEFEKLYGKDPYGRSARSDQSADGRFRRFSRVQIAESGYSLNMTCVGAANKQMDSSAPYAHVMRAAEALKSALDELETIAKRLQRSARAEVS